jgi:hypothetical protein
MQIRLLILAVMLLTVPVFSSLASAQTANPSKAAQAQASSKAANLSGVWDYGRGHGAGQSFSLSDPNGLKAGSEDDIPYQPWAREKTKSERTSTGPNKTFENTTDPVLKYCDPYGYPRIYMGPAKIQFIQTADFVYILYGYGPTWRLVSLNRKHPDDPDPTWGGDSIGWYENGDTLVVDTVGFNDKTWLDQVGHPHTEKLHLTERFRRVDQDTLQLDLTIDDPGAYTKPWNSQRIFTSSKTGFRYFWVCSMSENNSFFGDIEAPSIKTPGK